MEVISLIVNPLDPLDTYYRCYKCPNDQAIQATQYQTQKIIQNTVRVPSSLYTMNLGALTVYQKPNNTYEKITVNDVNLETVPGTNWNQMSDRKIPHIQYQIYSRASSTKHTITRCRPGAGSPGGIGVDIKHNSYDRYLAKLKGKGPVRRGIIPVDIPFNRASPIYGNKIYKTSIINCNCPIV